jgi:CelD/BcsL family acetyltransferase involved in cellulose biosynthesis
MATFETIILDSPQAMREAAPLWDDLWQRSLCRAPVMQAEFVAQWLEQFAPGRPCQNVVVLQDSRPVAALPIVGQPKQRIVKVGVLPSNPWCLTGDLLVDAAVDCSQALEVLMAALARLEWPMLWLEPVPLERPDWQGLLAAARRAGLTTLAHESYRIGQVTVPPDWLAYEASWSGNHRRHMRKALRRAEDFEALRLRFERDVDPNKLVEILRTGFELEDRGWKGRGGGSVLRTPGMFELGCRQALALLERQQLALTFLEHQGQSIAFEYGFLGKGTYFSPKVAYDETSSDLSPGQLLRLELLKRFSEHRDAEVVDFWGPLSDATSKWTTSTYAMGRVLIAPKRISGRLLLNLYKHARPWVQRLRRTK